MQNQEQTKKSTSASLTICGVPCFDCEKINLVRIRINCADDFGLFY